MSIPREISTPYTQAGGIINLALEFWLWITKMVDENTSADENTYTDSEEFFFNNIFKDMYEDIDTDGDKYQEQIGLNLDETRPSDFAPYALVQVMFTALAYAVQAMRAELNGETILAWKYIADANYWSGILMGVTSEKDGKENPAAILAYKRHSVNKAMFEEAIEHWRNNISPKISAQKAANELIKIVPLSHKKLAEVIAKERNKLKN